MDDPQNFCRFADMYSDRLKQAVGMLFLTAGTVESSLTLLLARAASHPHQFDYRMPFVFSGMDLRVKLSKLSELCFGTGTDREQVQKLTKKIEDLFDRRNAIAHNLGLSAGDGIRVRSMKLTRKGMRPDQVFTAERIEQIARLMFMRARQLDDLIPKAKD